jgi:hypothetical protein
MTGHFAFGMLLINAFLAAPRSASVFLLSSSLIFFSLFVRGTRMARRGCSEMGVGK